MFHFDSGRPNINRCVMRFLKLICLAYFYLAFVVRRMLAQLPMSYLVPGNPPRARRISVKAGFCRLSNTERCRSSTAKYGCSRCAAFPRGTVRNPTIILACILSICGDENRYGSLGAIVRIAHLLKKRERRASVL